MASPSTARVERRGHSLTGWLRIVARIAALLMSLIVLLPVHFLCRLLRIPVWIPRHFLGGVAWIAGARVKKLGKPLRRDVVFISNHVSWVDIVALAGATGSAFVSKSELRDAPVVGWLSTLNHTLFVERDDRMGVAGQIARLREALTELWSVTIFPEGTTTDGFDLLPFKGALLAVLDPPPPGVMVQPVFLDYRATPDVAWVGDEPGLDNALRIFARPGSFPLTIRFLEPFDPAACDGRKAVAAEARRRILSAMT
jgi:1-acyl-sn-glycerol-3-phosphate acyltransferase